MYMSMKHYNARSIQDITMSTLKRAISHLFGLLFIALGLLSASNAAAASLSLNEISYITLPGENIQIKLSMSGPASEPTSFTIDNPARIALDFPDTELAASNTNITVGAGITRNIRAVEAGGRTRVVISLVRLVPYNTRVENNNIYINLGGASQTLTTQTIPTAEQGEQASVQSKARNRLEAVDFRRGDEGDGRIIVDLTDPSTIIDMREEGGKILVDFLSTNLPKQLERRLDVIDFATPVKTIDTYADGDNVHMTVSTMDSFQHMAYQTGNVFTIEVKPLRPEEEEELKKDKFGYTGDKLSLNFQNIEVRAVLQLLADFTGLNMVTSDSVQGNITLRLKNVPWDQALDIILKARGLDMRKTGNVIMVAPTEEIAAREKLELEAHKQLEELAPLKSASLQINYAKAGDIATLLKTEGNSLLSERGSITIDERTNKLLIKDTEDNIIAIRGLIEELDVAVRQVLVESRVVLATDDFSKELGVRFGVTKGTDTMGTIPNDVTSGNLNATTDYVNGDTIEAPDRFNVDLPVTSLASSAGSIGFALTRLPLGTILELELSAAQAEGRSEIISSPRVITANQKEAVIEQGVEIPYQQVSSSGATNVSFKKAVLSLKVTPQITPDDRIIMDLQVNKDSPDYANTVLGQPPINTQQVNTQVLVDNGETVVLGGVYEQSKAHQINKVPFFGDLPLIGALFRNKLEQDDKSELLIFVTPKILKAGVTIQ